MTLPPAAIGDSRNSGMSAAARASLAFAHRATAANSTAPTMSIGHTAPATMLRARG
jgi:hypothetical protein